MTTYHYSVAQHSLLVCDIVKELGGDIRQQLSGLLHDAAEAYIGDIIAPIKEHCVWVQDLECNILMAIGSKWSVLLPYHHALSYVAVADRIALAAELHQWFNGSKAPDGVRLTPDATFYKNIEGVEKAICVRPCLGPLVAKQAFLNKFQELRYGD